ncbi:uncharacterized protein K452DRAFT_236018 [Aplosporella prunicola CBS 121167]|uniref:DUF1593-domain-containing protein n=1 Tax=Aplosporella prunicola CBS 121167 TaxID=1176127 RepID=A0A6A6B3P5_9PEZI|nr:uncharacterized protein K452DRAFT_236018 [Aplosporella prunicola CBS 121167]KAF2137341.1 hypothetical protein K452DRAFT_236018 [Aplosporella prunicola CBS 121167]
MAPIPTTTALRRILLSLLLLSTTTTTTTVVTAAAIPNTTTNQTCALARYAPRPRLFVLTDISGEPDDQMSLVRLLTHANELRIEGLAAVTSVWANHSVHEEAIHAVLGGYAEALANLNAHVPAAAAYPPAEELARTVAAGHPVYGLAALEQPLSGAAEKLVRAVDASAEPLWVAAWGGAAVLAEALAWVEGTRGEADVAVFVGRLRVYSISDQDDAGDWIRRRYPGMLFVVSLTAFSNYVEAAWNGISGETFRRFDRGGPDSSLVTNEWLSQHIRIGPLGQHYPDFKFIMEGDTPSFLNLLPNGLSDPSHPEWGGWGGRYELADASGRSAVFADAVDFVVGLNGDEFQSQYATIWRWRRAYQHDFAARMAWGATGDVGAANRHPVAVLNASCGPAALELAYRLGETVTLDASASWDPDGDALAFDWFHYRDVVQRLEGEIEHVSTDVAITKRDERGSVVEVEPKMNLTMHLILAVTDDRDMELTDYRRVILTPVA